VRVVLEGGDLARLAMPEATDAYVNAAFRPAGASYGEVFDPQTVRETHPDDAPPARRRYTVRAWDPARHRLTVDFVVHGDSGVAGPWAARARPGDVLVFTGPSGGYRPDPAADWHLLVGDESALPAIAASLEVLPAAARAVVRVVCHGPDHEIALESAATLDLRWLHRRGDAGDGDLLVDAVRALDFGAGRPFGFVHGEADEIRAVRRHLLHDRGLTRQDLSCSPYWHRTMTDEDWRRVKREYVAAMDAE
jgi:NADPH-dependent ferric siderophore reductase